MTLLDDIWTNIDFAGSEFWGKEACQAMKNMIHAVALVSSSEPVTRYVATSGSDTGNDCTDEMNPCLTIGHAVSKANSGDTLRLKSKGVYDRKKRRHGDQYVTLKVMLPDPPDTELKRFVEDWSKTHPYKARPD